MESSISYDQIAAVAVAFAVLREVASKLKPESAADPSKVDQQIFNAIVGK